MSDNDPAWAARFRSKVLDLNLESGCLVWLGGISDTGYGNFTIGPGERLNAHRTAWLLEYGELPPPHLVLDHLCRNRWCVNVAHLEAVTPSVNVLRGEKSSPRKDPALCASGRHAWTEENLFSYRGTVTCRLCKNEMQRKGYARRKAQKS